MITIIEAFDVLRKGLSLLRPVDPALGAAQFDTPQKSQAIYL
jgi:hypothetical protein